MKDNSYIRVERLTPELLNGGQPIWINPVGGLGDIIMLSSAMMRSYEQYNKQFHIARRTHYTSFFIGHPAVAQIGFPEKGSMILCNDYWSREDFKDVNKKAYAILLDIFGVSNHDQSLFVPTLSNSKTEIILRNIPWGAKNVVICTSSESPRKMMHPIKWHIIVEKLLSQNIFVLQVGGRNDIPIKGAYSIVGATTPDQVYNVLQKADAIITLDNFIMHAAKVVNKPTIALFGPTESSRYAYDGQIAMQINIEYCSFYNECLGPHVPDNYAKPCPLNENHCMNHHDEVKIVDALISIINK